MTPKYQDPTLSFEERAKDLVARMTLEEKVAQMQHDAPAVERLGIPAYNWWSECLHGVARAGLATVFPQAIGLAATWNPDLIQRIATAISDEARAKHYQALRLGLYHIYAGLTFWSPNINIFRDPRWGRGHETYGEDPYLSARIGVAFVQGLQGDHPHYLKLVATPKHFAVHSGPEPDRHHFDARVGEKDLRETYLPAFEACVREAGAFSVMGAYNRTNGEPCCASPTLLEQILRQEWGFEGYVVSDCWAIIDIYKHHQIVSTPAEAAAMAVKAGCDLNCGCTYPALRGAVEQGLIEEETIDRSVERLFRARFLLGMFDPPEKVPYTQIPYQVVASEAHQSLALQAARESIVLLKNEGRLLPLNKNLESIAVIGPNADDLRVLLGNYHGTPRRAITPLEGLREQIEPGTRLYYAPGCALAEGLPRLRPIPPACLRPTAADALQQGLRGVYFENAHLQGSPVLERVDPQVDFAWKDSSPLAGPWGQHFSACWSGTMIPPDSGTYQLGTRHSGRCRIYLDGNLVLERDRLHHPDTQFVPLELEASRLYDLRLEYESVGLDPQMQLLWTPPQEDLSARALDCAAKADVVILVLGLSSVLEEEEKVLQIEGFRGGDRTDIALPHSQKELLQKIQALGKPLVLVLLNGSAMALPWAKKNVSAIVEAWYPGEAGGTALAEVLFGDYNPAGRLPVTFYQDVKDLPPFEDYALAGRTYRYFQGEPLFPFGYGLSYTTFEYAGLRLQHAPEGLEVSCTITNSGQRPGDEVPQLYLALREPQEGQPQRWLAGFRRIHLDPGESATVRLHLQAEQLGYYGADGKFIQAPEALEVQIGSSSADIRLRGTVDIQSMS